MKIKIKSLQKKSEGGQIIVLLAVSLVVVMVVGALAVDGGMIYSERRFAQNAADSAALAGGGMFINSNPPENEDFTCPANSSYDENKGEFPNKGTLFAKAYISARNAALANNINDLPFLGYIVNGTTVEDYGINENHGVIIDCDSQSVQKNVDVIVRITSQTSTAFAHLIFPGELQTTNEAVATTDLGGEGTFGNAIVSLSPDCPDVNGKPGGIILQNAIKKLVIKNGGAFSNSCLSVGSNQKDGAIKVEGKFNIFGDVTGNANGIGKISDQIVSTPSQLSFTFPDPPNPKSECDTLSVKTPTTTGNGNNQVMTFTEGIYNGDIHVSKGKVVFTDGGLFCINGNIHLNNDEVIGKNVTFYITDGSAIHFNGNTTNILVAPTNPSDPYFGLLFYIEGSNGKMYYNGNSGSYYSGLVYAPKRNIEVGGNSDNEGGDCAEIEELEGVCEAITFPTQFVGWQVEISGSAEMDLLYNGDRKSVV